MDGIMRLHSWAVLSTVPDAWSLSCADCRSFVLVVVVPCLLCSLPFASSRRLQWGYLRVTQSHARSILDHFSHFARGVMMLADGLVNSTSVLVLKCSALHDLWLKPVLQVAPISDSAAGESLKNLFIRERCSLCMMRQQLQPAYSITDVRVVGGFRV